MQKLSLLLASYGIYASLDWRFGAILAVYTLCMLGLFKLVQSQPQQRKFLCGLGIAASVLNLAVFKYYDFCRDGFLAAAEYFKLAWTIPALEILLPVGISFYTFQAIAYIVSIAREEREPANALDSALYLAFSRLCLQARFVAPLISWCRSNKKLNAKLLQADFDFLVVVVGLGEKSLAGDMDFRNLGQSHVRQPRCLSSTRIADGGLCICDSNLFRLQWLFRLGDRNGDVAGLSA